MSQYTAVLLLGTDLGDRKKNLSHAKALINRILGDITIQSKILETEPIGFTSETLFLNQVVKINTSLSPIKCLQKVKEIEKEMGRTYTTPLKGEKYTSRIIDIDILSYENVIFKSNILKVPHHQIFSRSFVSILLNNLELA